jgi:hypothetical protein
MAISERDDSARMFPKLDLRADIHQAMRCASPLQRAKALSKIRNSSRHPSSGRAPLPKLKKATATPLHGGRRWLAHPSNRRLRGNKAESLHNCTLRRAASYCARLKRSRPATSAINRSAACAALPSVSCTHNAGCAADRASVAVARSSLLPPLRFDVRQVSPVATRTGIGVPQVLHLL